jgi:hypothetical protein
MDFSETVISIAKMPDWPFNISSDLVKIHQRQSPDQPWEYE